MAISPIDISMMQRMNEVAQIKHNENTRSDVQQNAITQNIDKQVNAQAEQVQRKDDSDKSSTEHDAREKGKNTYFSLEKSKREKKENEDNGKVTIKHSKSSFDMSI